MKKSREVLNTLAQKQVELVRPSPKSATTWASPAQCFTSGAKIRRGLSFKTKIHATA